MSITDNERVEIFSRIGQLEGARVNEASHVKAPTSNGNGSGAKAFASILVIISIIGGMSAIITPIRQQMEFMSKKIDTLQAHVSDGHPDRVVREVNILEDRMTVHETLTEILRTRIRSLEKDVAVLTQQMNDRTTDRYYKRDADKDKALIEEKIKNLQSQLNQLRELNKDVNIHTYHNQ